jgi:aminoglycoside phosphotransferase (APT) family kinase protein
MTSEDRLHQRLQAFVAQQPGFEKAVVEGLHKMPGGASKEMWGFDVQPADDPGSRLPMVVRYDRSFPLPVSIGLKEEFGLLRDVHAQGIEVPKPYWYGDEGAGPPFYIIERIPGETIVRRLHRDSQYTEARKIMTDQLGRILAKIHRMPNHEKMGYLPHRHSRAHPPPLAEVNFYERVFRRFSPEPHPALELALRWLKQNAPRSNDRSLVHGDYRLGNVMFTREGVRSILDWELAHIGDPMEDVGYISVKAWRFGNSSKPIGGIGEREAFRQAYADAGGFPVDVQDVFFWEVFGNFKWAVITILQMVPFLNGSSPSIELASLGRMTAEVEMELLNLIG